MNLNIYGPITDKTSYGCVTRNIIHSIMQMPAYESDSGYLLWAHNIEGNFVSYPESEEQTVGLALRRSETWGTNAPCLKIFHANQLKTFISTKAKKIGFPIFETDRFTDSEWRQLDRLDTIVVTSEWAKNICLKQGLGIATPIIVAPLGVNREIFSDQLIPTDNDIAKDDALKLFVNGKWECRKGHDILLKAFEKAFCSTDNVTLVMNCFNAFIGQKRNDDWCLYYKTSKLGNKIFVLDKYLSSQKNVANLMASCDVGLFLSKAEGWNLGLLEMMSMGKNVIATNVTAHTEYCTNENSLLVDCPDMEPANDGVFFNGFGQWHSIGPRQIDEIAAYMRNCYDLKRAGKLEKNLAGVETAKKFSWANTAAKCLEACK